METIAQAIQYAQHQLLDASDSPRLDAELLVGHLLGLTRNQVMASFTDHLTAEQSTGLRRLVERRASGEPIAYIVGYREFFGRRFRVSPAVLSPRPETELLVEWALVWLSSRPEAVVVDVGVGSGAIAVSIALNAPATVRVVGIDISPDALAVAHSNAEALGAPQVAFRLGNLLEPVDEPLDLVISNLPYLRPDQIDSNRDLAAEPRIALDGGSDGLQIINQLIDNLPARLAPNGAVAIELDPSQAGTVADRLQMTLPDARVAIHQDLASLDRFVTAVRQS